jgi:hypothetical protein
MQRRTMLRSLVMGLPAAAGAAATGIALRSAAHVRDGSQVSLESLKHRVDDLKAHFEQADARNRKLLKAAVVLAALSLGLDASSLL